MAKVIFMHFDDDKDGIYDAKIGEPIVRLAQENSIDLSKFSCKECGETLLSIEHIFDEPTTYTEDEELELLTKFGAIGEKEAQIAQQYAISPKVRIASMMLIKGDVLIKPYKKTKEQK
ncbi:MAG: hypothetical protein LBP40_00170 [Campylobacteraceae bacterium]|jgi:hypothetical protein|nr:hypothetical protein [Campylobacteraceae bacterium]